MTTHRNWHRSPNAKWTEPMPDFGVLPPEINSANMYSGAGSQPLVAAARAWEALAVELESYTAGCTSVLAQLQHDAWSGEAATAMSNAVTPYLAWAATAAEQVAEVAGKARAAAAAYEAALRAMVPPQMIATNRAHVATLTETNFLGQNTPAIAAAESAYAEMWAQDAAAMYDYAQTCAEFTTLVPFGSPPQIACKTPLPGVDLVPANAASTPAPTRSRQASPREAVLPWLNSGAPSTANAPASLDRLQRWEALVIAFANLNTLLMVPLQLVFALAETTFDTGNYAYAVKAGLPTHPVATAQPKVAVPPVGPEPARPTTSSMARNLLLENAYPRGRVIGSDVSPDWTAALQRVDGVEKPMRSDPRHPTAGTTTNAATPPAMPTSGVASLSSRDRRPGGNRMFRMRDRRFKMPRPAVGG